MDDGAIWEAAVHAVACAMASPNVHAAQMCLCIIILARVSWATKTLLYSGGCGHCDSDVFHLSSEPVQICDECEKMIGLNVIPWIEGL
jgi:hypothetical protein